MRLHATAAVLCALMAAVSQRTSAGDNPLRPQLVVPRIAAAPTIDGIIQPAEWERAAVVSGFILAQGGKMGTPNARTYIAHDGTNLYMGVYCELLPGQVPTRNYRRRDEPVYMDTNQLELWLTPPFKGQLVTYQMIGNAYGAIFDNRQVPDLGSVVVGWNARWTFKNSFKAGEYWMAELSVPFADFGVGKVSPAEPWGGLIAIAWPQRSWPFTGGWYKNVQNHAQLIFADDGTAVRLEDMSSLLANKFAPKCSVINAGKDEAAFELAFRAGGVEHKQTVKVPAGGVAACECSKDIPPAKDAQKGVLTITAPGNRTLLTGEWIFDQPDPAKEKARKVPEPEKPFAMRTLFAPLACGVKAWADLLDYPKRDALAVVRFSVLPAGQAKAIATADVKTFAYDSAETYLWLPKDLTVGDYEVKAEFLDKAGALLDAKSNKFTRTDLKKEFYWLGNTHGTKRTIAPPFTALKAAKNSLAVWGREYRMDGALPAQVVSRSAEMLAAPATFVAIVDGKPVEAKVSKPFAVTTADDVCAEFTGQYEVANVTLDVAARAEFDGMLFYTLKATPRAGAKVERLYLSLPVKAECATTFYSTAGGWSGAFNYVPNQPSDKPFWTSSEIADFVPYVGLTDDDRALQWFADTDADWVLGKDAPCVTLVRREKAVEMQVALVRKSGELTAPFSAGFGLIATPVKPLPSGWRNTNLDFSKHYGSRTNLFYGAGHGGCPIDPHDSATLAKVHGVDTAGKNPDEILDQLLPRSAGGVAPAIDEKHLKAVLAGKADGAMKLLHYKQGSVRSCYFFNAHMYFEGYRSKAFQSFFPGDWQLDPPSGWFHLTVSESYRDFFAFYMNLWMKHWTMPGLYFDETYISPDYNVFNGNGRVLPDGTIRPTVPLMQQRAFMQRMRQLFIDNKQVPFIWVHTSNYMATHAISAVDIAMFGEDRAPNEATDYIDATPAVLMRSIGRSQKFGFIPVWMDQTGRGGKPVWSRLVWGWCWQHDTVPEYHSCDRTRPLVGLRVAWGIMEDDVQFVPYWKNAGAIKSDDPQFLVSAWTRPNGKVLLQILNHHKDNKTAAAVTLTPKALGLKDGFKVYDLESHPEWAAAKAEVAELQNLERTNPDDARKRAAEIHHKLGDEKRYNAYALNKLKVVGNGSTFQVTVPPRDFVTLIAE
jgi:hypothetical protein